MIQYLQGDCRGILKNLPSKSVHCCITSPPYWALRDYGIKGQLGMEDSPEIYTKNIVEIFNEVRRVIKDDGTVWVNIGDTYFGGGFGVSPNGNEDFKKRYPKQASNRGTANQETRQKINTLRKKHSYLKSKDLIGIPWRIAFALQKDGWYLRSDIIWHKPNPMPESVIDRCTKAHEYIFLLSKNEKYYYDANAIKEPAIYKGLKHQYASVFKDACKFAGKNADKQRGHSREHAGFNDRWDAMSKTEQCSGMRNKHDVWTIATSGYKGEHFAVFPPNLIRPCVLAGCPVGGTILDPFGGSGTTAMVAEQEGRNCILIELNEKYIALQKNRTQQTSLLVSQI